MSHNLPNLPWKENALEPHISAETISFHYGKHHNAYLTKLNAAVENTENASKTLEELIMTTEGGLFNNAAQVWNHSFYWNCLAPNAGGEAKGLIADRIKDKWGSFEKFKEAFTNAAATNFGSGWTWLVEENNNNLAIFNTANADSAIKHEKKPLMVIDVWEHAYYVDYRNARPKYIEAFWNLVNWDFVNSNL